MAKRLCVRINDNQNLDYKVYMNNIPDESQKDRCRFSAKCVEQLVRGCSPTSVAERKKYQQFQTDLEGLEPKTLPAGYHSFSREEKKETVKKLIKEIADELTAAAMSRAPVQDVGTQADFPDDMEVGDGSGPDPASEGVANTLRPPDDSLQNVPLGSVRSEGSPRVPPGLTLDQGRCTLSQLDREVNKRLSLESRSYRRRGSPEEIPSQLREGILAEDPQYQLSKDPIEDAGSQGSYYPASDFGVKNIGTSMVHGEEDGLLRNRSISEALEVVPRLTGRYRKNVGDIRPEVSGGSADGDLPSKQIMHVSMEDVDMQVNNSVEIQGDEVPVGAPNPDLGNTFSNDASSLNVAWNQCDNPEDCPPSRALVPLEDIVWFLSDLVRWASRFPGTLQFQWSDEVFRPFVAQLQCLESVEDLGR